MALERRCQVKLDGECIGLLFHKGQDFSALEAARKLKVKYPDADVKVWVYMANEVLWDNDDDSLNEAAWKELSR